MRTIHSYLNLIQTAESFGTSERQIMDWVHNEDMPHVHDQGHLLFEKEQIIGWATRRGISAYSGFLADSDDQGDLPPLEELLRRGGIWRNISQEQLPELFASVIDKLPDISPQIRAMIQKRLTMENGITLAPIGKGYALPHPTMRIALGESSACIALILLSTPLENISAPDAIPVSKLLFFLSPTPRLHLTMLGMLAALAESKRLLNLNADCSDSEIFQLLTREIS